MNLMLQLISTVYQQVINIDSEEHIQKIHEGFIDISLKGSWAASQSKRNHQIFECAISGLEGGQVLMSLCNLNPMESLPYIQFREDASSRESDHEFIYQGKGISILSGNRIQLPIVYTKLHKTEAFQMA